MSRLFLFISFVFIGLISSAQTYNFDKYSVEDGLAINSVLSIYQDSKGFIWIGTNGGGVSVFDGKEFKNITEKDGIASNVVYSIDEGDNGEVYFATKEGLSVLKKGKYTTYDKSNGLPSNLIFNVLHTKKYGVLLCSSAGVERLDVDTIVPLENDTSLFKEPTIKAYEDSDGAIWFGTMRNGTYKYNDGVKKHYGVADGVSYPFVFTIIEDFEKDVWIGTAKGICKLNKESDRFEEIQPHKNTLTKTTSNTMQSSTIDQDGNLWFGSASGLYKYSDGKFTVFRDENGLSLSNVWTVCVDNEGSLWAGTNGKGLSKFNRKGEVFTNYSVKEGLSNDIVLSIFQDSRGTFWFGSEEGVTQKDDTSDFYIHNKSEPTPGHFLGWGSKGHDIVEDMDGNVWIASGVDEDGVLKYSDGDRTSYGKKDGFLDNKVYSILVDGDQMYFGTYAGIVKYEDEKFEPFLIEDIKGEIWDIVKTKNNRLWFATENGAVMHDGTSVEFFNETHGFVKGRVRTIVEDNAGMLWFSTEQGVFRYDGKGFSNINSDLGLSADNIFSLLIDKNEFLWIGTAKGIQKLDIKEYNQSNKVVLKKYAKLEGFIGVECNMNAAFEDNEGRLWFGTVKGATVFDPALEVLNNLEPQTHITKLRLEFEDFNFSEYADSINYTSGLPSNLVLPYEKNHLSFDFIANSFVVNEKVRYQYMLEGLDKGWLPITNKTEAVYPHIPAGDYTFKVKGMNNDGVWNVEPRSFSFTILPPWYQTWWAILLYIIVVVSGFLAYTKYRTAALKRQKAILEEQVEERTAEVVKEKEKVEEINKQVILQHEEIEEKNNEIMDSINYAKGIQDAILPHFDKVKEHLPNSFILFRPKDVVSGDFYWMEKKDDIVFFTAADCTGHGVPGAFVSMVGVNGLNRSVNGFALRKTNEILNKLRDLVEQTFRKRKDGMDMGLCGINFKTKELQFAGANNPLWVIRNKKYGPLNVDGEIVESKIGDDNCDLYEVKADKQPVGSFEAAVPFTNRLMQLEEGDSIYVFSDGYPDQFGGPKGKKFMSKSMKKLLISLYESDMEDQRKVLDDSINNWMNEADAEQIDDICVFGVRV